AIFCSLLIFPLAGVLGDMSWRLPFLLYGFGLVVFAALLFSRSDEEAQADQGGSAEQVEEDETSIWTWMPWHYVLLSLFVGAITFLPTIYLPYQFKEQAGLSPSGIAIILMGTALVSGIMAMLYGKARRRFSVHAVFLFSFGAAAAGMAIVAFANSLPAVLLGFVVYSLGNSWFVPNVMTSLGGKLANHQQARAAGIVKAGHFLSTPLCVVIVEPYARQFGPVSVMLMVSVAAFAIFLLMVFRTLQLGRRGGPQLAPQPQTIGH
ncbi:MAG: MFS transporter, partial [Novosphingobium sp.]|nr:MFS transporter [Novosphingobium sp.]